MKPPNLPNLRNKSPSEPTATANHCGALALGHIAVVGYSIALTHIAVVGYSIALTHIAVVGYSIGQWLRGHSIGQWLRGYSGHCLKQVVISRTADDGSRVSGEVCCRPFLPRRPAAVLTELWG